MFPDPDAFAVQAAVCDRYRDLACAVLHLSVLDARQTSLPESFRLDARLFLMEPAGAWLMALLDLDPEETRRRAMADWMAREGTRHNISWKGSGSNGTNG